MIVIFETYDIQRKRGGFAIQETPCRYFRTKIHKADDGFINAEQMQVWESDFYYEPDWTNARRAAYDRAAELAILLDCSIEEHFFQEFHKRTIERLPQRIGTNPCPKKETA